MLQCSAKLFVPGSRDPPKANYCLRTLILREESRVLAGSLVSLSCRWCLCGFTQLGCVRGETQFSLDVCEGLTPDCQMTVFVVLKIACLSFGRHLHCKEEKYPSQWKDAHQKAQRKKLYKNKIVEKFVLQIHILNFNTNGQLLLLFIVEKIYSLAFYLRRTVSFLKVNDFTIFVY